MFPEQPKIDLLRSRQRTRLGPALQSFSEDLQALTTGTCILQDKIYKTPELFLFKIHICLIEPLQVLLEGGTSTGKAKLERDFAKKVDFIAS